MGMSSCTLLKLDEILPPQFRLQCVLDGKEYDYSGRGSFLNARRPFTAQCYTISWENVNRLEIQYDIPASSIHISCDMTLASTDYVKYNTKYYLKRGEYDTVESGIVGWVNKDPVESCSFSFEKPEPEDSLALYYFLFDMDLVELDSNKPVALRNGKITFYKGHSANEAFVAKIKDDE